LLGIPPVVTDVEPPSTARSGRHRRLHRWRSLFAGPALALSALAVLVPARPAGADPLASARAQAAQLTAQLQAEAARLDAASQAYDAAEQRVQQLQQQLQQNQAQLVQDRAQVTADQAALRTEAVQAYMTGTSDTGLESLLGSGDSATAAHEYQAVASSSITTAVDNLRQSEAALARQQSELQATQAQAQAALAKAAAARQAAQAAVDAQQATLAKVKGQIAVLVAQQQAAEQAAQEAAFRARFGAGGAPVAASGAAARAVQAAESQIGVPYQWGGETPGVGFDCSGLTQWAWGQAGVSIPRTAAAQYDAIVHIPLSAMQPGDLVFWGSGGSIDHVGMYVGNGDVVHAPSTGQRVRIQAIWNNGLIGAGRP